MASRKTYMPQFFGSVGPPKEATSSQHSSDVPLRRVSIGSDEAVAANKARESLGKPKVGGKFIRSETDDASHEGIALYRKRVEGFLQSKISDAVLAAAIAIDLIANAAAIDARAVNQDVPSWVGTTGTIALVLYTIEYSLTFFAGGLRYMFSSVGLLDTFILVVGYSEAALDAAGVKSESFGLLRLLRLVRIMRLLKLCHKMRYLQELRKLMTMAASCAKSLAWSFLLAFVVMSAWAMLLVDLVHPIVRELHEEGVLPDPAVTETVMGANLLLFKTVVAGDSWGGLAVPVISRYPASAVVFIGSHLTLVYGVLNLIVAVVVDSFAEKRQRDIDQRAQELEEDEAFDLDSLQKMFQQIDDDCSGELSLDELLEGAKRIPEFQSRLRVMDIDERDLEQLFVMLDEDNGGSIDAEEFIHALTRWIHDSKSATRFVKYNVEHLLQEHKLLMQEVQDIKLMMKKARATEKQRYTLLASLAKDPSRRGGDDQELPREFHGPTEEAVDTDGGDMARGFDRTLKMMIQKIKDDAKNCQQRIVDDVGKDLLKSLKNAEETLQLTFGVASSDEEDDSAMSWRRENSRRKVSVRNSIRLSVRSSGRSVRISPSKWSRDGVPGVLHAAAAKEEKEEELADEEPPSPAEEQRRPAVQFTDEPLQAEESIGHSFTMNSLPDSLPETPHDSHAARTVGKRRTL